MECEEYLDDVSDRQEVSSRKDILSLLLFLTPPLNVNMRRRMKSRSLRLTLLLLRLSTENFLSVTSTLFKTALLDSNDKHQNRKQV